MYIWGAFRAAAVYVFGRVSFNCLRREEGSSNATSDAKPMTVGPPRSELVLPGSMSNCMRLLPGL